MNAPARQTPVQRRSWLSLLTWCVLGAALMLCAAGHIFFMHELAWNDVTAEVKYGHELHFSTADGEEQALLHLSPPAGEAAWQEGQKVKLSYHRRQPQFAVLRNARPEPWSDTVTLWGLRLLFIGAPLALLVAYRRRRERARAGARPTAKVHRSVPDWLAFAAVGLTLGLALVCAYAGLCMVVGVAGAIHYLPDCNGIVEELTVVGLVALFGGVLLGLISRALYRRDRRRYVLNRE